MGAERLDPELLRAKVYPECLATGIYSVVAGRGGRLGPMRSRFGKLPLSDLLASAILRTRRTGFQ